MHCIWIDKQACNLCTYTCIHTAIVLLFNYSGCLRLKCCSTRCENWCVFSPSVHYLSAYLYIGIIHVNGGMHCDWIDKQACNLCTYTCIHTAIVLLFKNNRNRFAVSNSPKTHDCILQSCTCTCMFIIIHVAAPMSSHQYAYELCTHMKTSQWAHVQCIYIFRGLFIPDLSPAAAQRHMTCVYTIQL